MRIATWNVNSIKQRLDHLATFVKSADPDVVCLQELKCVDEAFPREEVEALGYNVVTHGQKAYNGVAILSKRPLEDVRRGLPGDESDEQARYLEGVISTSAGAVRVASIYLPNGNPIGTPKFGYKLAWMDRLHAHARRLLALEEPLVLCGDYNVIPEPRDASDPAAWTNDALFQPESRASSGSCSTSGSWTLSAPAAISRASTRSGTIRRELFRGITAFASIISCSRPRPRTSSGRPRSAKKCVAGTSRPTTCR
jgi:exodeoxyribonuclease-3